MYNLKILLQQALKEGWAVPHFNVSNLEQLKGVCEATRKLQAPLMIGTSEGERSFIGLAQAIALVNTYREEYHLPLFLNADHTTSVENAKKAIDAGYNSIHIDLSRKNFKENLIGTGEIVQYARTVRDDMSIEGELGYLVTESSRVYKKKIFIDPATFTKPEEAARFVRITGIDRFAPAVGNLHGIAVNKPKLDYKLITKLRAILPDHVAMVLHGGSGNSPAVFKKVIALGFNNIHISTELRLAYRKGLEQGLKENKNEVAPYKIAAPAIAAVQKVAEKYIRIFGASGRT